MCLCRAYGHRQTQTIQHLCDDVDVGTIDVSRDIGVAVDAGTTPKGDAEAILITLKEIGPNTAKGRLVGSGTAIIGKVSGLRRAPVVGGRALRPVPRSVKGHNRRSITHEARPCCDDAATSNILDVVTLFKKTERLNFRVIYGLPGNL